MSELTLYWTVHTVVTRTLVDIAFVVLTAIRVIVFRAETRHLLPSPVTLSAVEVLLTWQSKWLCRLLLLLPLLLVFWLASSL